MKYSITKSTKTLVVTLDTESGKYSPRVTTFNDPNVILGNNDICLLENGEPLVYLQKYEIGLIDGVESTSLVDAVSKISVLIDSIKVFGDTVAKSVVSKEALVWDNKLLINCGDSTTWQMTATGYGFDWATAFHRRAGNKMEKITGYVNFGSSGYTLSGFVNDALTTPPTINTTTNLGLFNWDYYGHNIQAAIPQKTAIAYRKSIPNQEVVWSLCYGINDCILYSANGNKTLAELTDYLTGLLNSAVALLKTECPKDTVILRMPNTMAARPFNSGAGFPSPSAYPSFGADKPTDVALVTKWNTAIRNAYLLASQTNLNTILLDTHKKVFGDLSAEVDAGSRPFMQDLVHPGEFGYNAIIDEIANIFNDDRLQKDYSRVDEAERRAILLANSPFQNYANYLNNTLKYKLLLSNKNPMASGSTYIDIPFSKTELDSKIAGKTFYLKNGDVAMKIISATTTSIGADRTRITGVTVSAEFQASFGDTSVYVDADGNTDLWIKSQLATAKPRTVFYGTIAGGGTNYIDLSFDLNEGRISTNYRQALKNGTLIIATGSQTLSLSSISYSSYINENQIRIGITGSFGASTASQMAIYFGSSTVAPVQFEGIASTPLMSAIPLVTATKSYIINNIDRFKGINIKSSTNVAIPSIVTVDVYKNASNSRTLVGTLTIASNSYNSNTLNVTGTILYGDIYEFVITSATTSATDLLSFKIEPVL
jgi:hypothetical protein